MLRTNVSRLMRKCVFCLLLLAVSSGAGLDGLAAGNAGQQLGADYFDLIRKAGWFNYVQRGVDFIKYYNGYSFAMRSGPALGYAQVEFGKRVAYVATRGRSKEDIAATIVHEACHLQGGTEEQASQMAARFLADLQKNVVAGMDGDQLSSGLPTGRLYRGIPPPPQVSPEDRTNPEDKLQNYRRQVSEIEREIQEIKAQLSPEELENIEKKFKAYLELLDMYERLLKSEQALSKPSVEQIAGRDIPRESRERIYRLPAGTLITVRVIETISTRNVANDEPVRFEVDEDVREFRNGSVVIPRHSVIVGRVAESKQAGRLKRRSRIVLHFDDLRIPNNPSSYSAPLRIVGVRNKEIDREGRINGDGNPIRDTFFLLFPPTTIFQLLSLPRRGPQITFRAEERVVLKLMQELEIRDLTQQLGKPLVLPVRLEKL